jgi:TolB-like protein/tetratricopeptide (TPR) repeat protein
MTSIFVSYSHDSAEHSHRVLQLAEALRSHGIDASIDADVVRPPHGWPHWCEEQLRPENAEYVLLICTSVYCDRVENRVAFDEGRGAFWEGSIIYDYIYEEKGNQRFIPLLLDGARKSCIPRPIRNHTHYAIDHYDFTNRGYRRLYRELTKQNTKRKPAGEVVHLDSTYPGVAFSWLLAGTSPLVAGDAEPAKSHPTVAERPRQERWAVPTLLALLFVAAVAAFLFRSSRQQPKPALVAPIGTLAVLPFKPLVASQRDEALELGMADTLIAKISTIDGVTVRPLTAVRHYGGVEQDPIAAGRALKVDAVLDGSIQDDARQIRVTVRLLRVADGRQLWMGQFDTPSSTVFSLHDRISSALVDELSFKLTKEERTRLRQRDTHNPEAYRAYLLGRFYSDRPHRDRYLKAIGYFQRAIALDPGYALAYAGLAYVHGALPICCDYPSGPSSAAARDAARKAIAIDPGLAEAHVAFARTFFFECDWRPAEEACRRALRLDPSNVEAHRLYAHLLSNTGRHSEALREVDEALHLDPLSLMTNTMKAQFLIHAGRVDAAIAADKGVLEINSNFWVARLLLGNAYVRKAMYAEALEEYRLSYEHSVVATEPRARAAHLLAITGREQEARKILSELTAMSKDRYVPPYNLALIHAGLGEHAKALRELHRACAERDVHLVFIGVEPLWNVLHNEPGWAEVERCVHLPPVVESQIHPLAELPPPLRSAVPPFLSRAFSC